jgi:hypothetical protein
MRKWHRWLSILFGVFAIWIATTGLLSQLVPIVQRGGFEGGRDGPPPPPPSAMPPGFKCPETLTCRPKQQGTSIVGTLHHLHSGESFGPAGQIVSILTGSALLFFAFSGLWMYVEMFRGRLRKTDRGGKVRGGRFFWD